MKFIEFDLLSLYEQSLPLDLNNHGNHSATNVPITSAVVQPTPLSEKGMNIITPTPSERPQNEISKNSNQEDHSSDKDKSQGNQNYFDNKVELRIMEKLLITILNGKIQDLKIMGQLMIDGVSKKETEDIELSFIWGDPSAVHKKLREGPLIIQQADKNLLK